MDDQNRNVGGTGGYGTGASGMGSTAGASGMGTGAGAANTPNFGEGGAGAGGATGVQDRANQVMGRAAEGLETAANRLNDFADRQRDQGGPMGRANDFAHQAANTMESTARYLRDNDVRALQGDVERMVREKPLQSLLIGVAAGWVLGKILR